jgi:septal ring factor EnvC (AmiA/AmiB activator)
MRIFLVILLITFSLPLAGQDLQSKREQLKALQEELLQQENLIHAAKAGKAKSQSELRELESKRKALAAKLKKLRSSEESAKQHLLQTEDKIRQTSHQMADLHLLCQQEYLKLFEAHHGSRIDPKKKFDGRLLAALILRTAEEIRGYESERSGLEKQKKQQNKKYEDLIWSRIVEKKRGKKYSQQAAELKTDIKRLSASEQAALDKYEELQSLVEEMNELIAKLQAAQAQEEFSFEFSSEKLPWPLQGEILRGFGEQPAERYKVSVLNNGIDISAAEGSAVKAVEAGVVAFSQWYGGAGKLVIIDHKNGYFSLYSHNSTLLVSKGDEVDKLQEIALSGSSGTVEVPQLHFELRRRGKPVDPLDYLE